MTFSMHCATVPEAGSAASADGSSVPTNLAKKRCSERSSWTMMVRIVFVFSCGLNSSSLSGTAFQTLEWWLESREFFGGLKRQRIWIFWRRILHTCHHRTQLQTWLRLAGQHVPMIYGPSGDENEKEDDPTYSVEAAKRGG
jgi:DinB family